MSREPRTRFCQSSIAGAPGGRADGCARAGVRTAGPSPSEDRIGTVASTWMLVRRQIALLLGLSTLAAGPVLATPTSADSAAAMRPFHHGVFLGDDVTTPERVAGAIRDYTRMVGVRPTLVKTFFRLDADFGVRGWAGRVVREIGRSEAANYIALDLSWPGGPGQDLLDAIARGDADDRLRRIAGQLRDLPGDVFIEPGWEMNGDWDYAWQGAANGGGEDAPARFVSAWRHVVEVFRAAGATHVQWVFSPNIGNPIARAGAGEEHWNWYGNYYPGDAWVDVVGAHGFHAPDLWGGEYTDFATLFDGAAADRLLSDLSRRFPDKPILIGEFAAEETSGHDKGEWIRDAFRQMHARANLIGSVWFHMRKEANWRVDSSASALAAYREAMKHPRILLASSAAAIRLAAQ
jgi:hypothetical protein